MIYRKTNKKYRGNNKRDILWFAVLWTYFVTDIIHKMLIVAIPETAEDVEGAGLKRLFLACFFQQCHHPKHTLIIYVTKNTSCKSNGWEMQRDPWRDNYWGLSTSMGTVAGGWCSIHKIKTIDVYFFVFFTFQQAIFPNSTNNLPSSFSRIINCVPLFSTFTAKRREGEVVNQKRRQRNTEYTI